MGHMAWRRRRGGHVLCCVVLCCAVLPVVEGGTEILREGREASGGSCDAGAVVGSCDTFPCRREAYVVFTNEQETNPGAWERRATTLFLCP